MYFSFLINIKSIHVWEFISSVKKVFTCRSCCFTYFPYQNSWQLILKVAKMEVTGSEFHSIIGRVLVALFSLLCWGYLFVFLTVQLSCFESNWLPPPPPNQSLNKKSNLNMTAEVFNSPLFLDEQVALLQSQVAEGPYSDNFLY